MMTEMVDAYRYFSLFYDLEYASWDADVAFYQSFAEQANGPVLELGCGTGRVLSALEATGLPLTGVDQSASMLAMARERLLDTTQLVHTPMESLTPDMLTHAPYWMAFAAINTFLHLPDAEAQIKTLERLRGVVVDGGLLLLDVMVPDPLYLAGLDGRLVPELSLTLDDGRRVDKLVSRTHNLATQTIETTVFFDTVDPSTGTLSRIVDSYSTRYIHRFELEHLLHRAGWQLISLYGSYDMEPYGPESERMIALATWGTT